MKEDKNRIARVYELLKKNDGGKKRRGVCAG